MKLRFVALLLFSPLFLKAQHDTTYYYSYKSKITARFYFSNKSTTFLFRNIDGHYNLRYRPNTTNNMGIGATYKSFTLNLAYGFKFLNPDVGRGDTRYLDLQFHRYGRKVVMDVFGQFYKGYYLSPKGYAAPDGNNYYVRPDLSVNMLGASAQYVFNSRRFSYRASFLQNEWQKKSAGTFLLGFELYFGNVFSDSTLFPTSLDPRIANRNYRQINFVEAGPSLGYAYTLVIKKHFFITGSATLGLDLGNTVIKRDNGRSNTTGLCTNSLFRVSAGYNSYLWAVNLLYVTNNVQLASHVYAESPQLNTANIRLHFSRRIAPSQKLKKYLKVIN